VRASTTLAFGLAAVAGGTLPAEQAHAQGKPPPVVLLFDENENVKEKRSDTNGDGRYDEYVYYEGGKPARAEQDSDHDGRLDTKLVFGADGKPVSQERDANGDGKPDQWIEFKGGEPSVQRDDLDFDGKPNATTWFEAGQPTRREGAGLDPDQRPVPGLLSLEGRRRA
jgi:hypothetical protein